MSLFKLMGSGLGFGMLCALLTGVPVREVQADPCPAGVLPQHLVTLAKEPLFSGFSANYPYAAMVTWVGISGVVGGGPFYGLDSTCHNLAGGVSAEPSVVFTETNASLDWTFEDGDLYGDHNAFISGDAAIAGVSGATALSEFGFRDILDVSSTGTEMVQLDFTVEFSGTWSQPLCFQGIGRFQPLDEFKLYLRDITPPPTTSILVGNLTTIQAKIGEQPFAGSYSVTVRPNTTVVVDLFYSLVAPAHSFTLIGDDFCEGGVSTALLGAPNGLSITFSTPSAGVTIVPRSGINYSSTVPEPEDGLLFGILALAALAVWTRRRQPGWRS